MTVAERLLKLGANLLAADPHLESRTCSRGHHVWSSARRRISAAADLILVLTDHDALDWNAVERHAPRVLDTRRRVSSGLPTDSDGVPVAGFRVMSAYASGSTGASPFSPLATDTRPTVTVIMPIRNEGAFIARSLAAVLGQDYPAELLQVLVADGMSDDYTREIVGEPHTRIRRTPSRSSTTRGASAHQLQRRARPGPGGGHRPRRRTHDHRTRLRVPVRCALAASGADNVGGRMDAEGQRPGR